MKNEKIKVLVGDDTAEYGVKIASKLREMGFYAYTRKKDGNAIFDSITIECPDVIVADMSLPNLDGPALMKKSNEMLINKPQFIITSSFKNSYIERQAIEEGASYFLEIPFEIENLSSIIKSIVRKKVSPECKDAEIIVTDIIHGFGIPAHIKGYHYLRTAILEAVADHQLMHCVTKQLYPSVAQKHETTSSRVERAIRHAIDTAWSRGNTETMNSFFGYSVNLNHGKPTNSEFIALVTDKLRLHLKST